LGDGVPRVNLAAYTIPGGKPVISLPGQTPKSPKRMVGPVFVTVDPANTAKDSAVPSNWALACVSKPKKVKAAIAASDLYFMTNLLSNGLAKCGEQLSHTFQTQATKQWYTLKMAGRKSWL